MQPGDFILTHGDHWQSRVIRLGQSIRRDLRPYAHWNHAALVIEPGLVAEALSAGVVTSRLDKYAEDYVHVPVPMSDQDRAQVLAFAESVLAARWRYGWRTIVTSSLACAFGSGALWAHDNTAICSGFVAEALVRAGLIFPRHPTAMMPADLAKFFEVPGRKGASR